MTLEEISRQHNIDSIVSVSFISIIKKNMLDKEKYKIDSLRRKRKPGSIMLEPSPAVITQGD